MSGQGSVRATGSGAQKLGFLFVRRVLADTRSSLTVNDLYLFGGLAGDRQRVPTVRLWFAGQVSGDRQRVPTARFSFAFGPAIRSGFALGFIGRVLVVRSAWAACRATGSASRKLSEQPNGQGV